MNFPRIAACSLLIFSVCSFLNAEEVNILEEGNFETTKNGMPSGFIWAGFAGDPTVTPNRFALVTEDSQVVRITVPPGTQKEIGVVRRVEPIPLPKDWTALRVSVKLRVRDYVQGSLGWNGVKVFVVFYDSNGAPFGSEVPAITVKEVVAEWTPYEEEVAIPPGAAAFVLTVGLHSSAGEVDIDDLVIVPIK